MHINNVSQKTSMQMVAGFMFVAGIYTAVLLAMYFFASGGELSIPYFWNWVTASYNGLLADNPEDPWIAWVTFIILPAVFYLGLIGSIIARQMALNKLNSSLNLKSVDFLQGRINFNFNKSQYNFVCGYSDINALQMILKTTVVHTKYGSYIALKEIVLNFTVLNNKKFSISNTPLSPTRFIYKIIDYSRNIKNFTYRFEGPGEVADIKEKIENYLNKGYKPILTKNLEEKCKGLSIILFIVGISFIADLKEEIVNYFRDGLWFICLPFLVSILVSFVLDIILIADKIQEQKFRGYNG